MNSWLTLYTTLALFVRKSNGERIRGLAIGPIPTKSPIFVCPICGEDAFIVDEEAIIDVPGMGNVTCIEIFALANAGLVDEPTCLFAQLLVEEECGCEDVPESPTPVPVADPTTVPSMTPTEKPVGETETPTPDPNSEPTTESPTDAPTDETATETETPSPTTESLSGAPTEETATDAPALAPIGPLEVIVVVSIVFDGFAPETGWSIEDTNGTVIFDSPIGSYPPLTPSTEKPVVLLGGNDYVFTIVDLFGDGMSNPEDGTYMVKQDNTTLVSGGGNFGFSNSTNFTTLP